MDSEDEREAEGIVDENGEVNQRRLTTYIYGHDLARQHRLLVRAYYKDELDMRALSIVRGDNQNEIKFPALNEVMDRAATFRILRFFKNLIGFHTGDTCLAGRHESRYVSLMKRYREFESDLLSVLEGATLKEYEQEFGHMDGTYTVYEYEVSDATKLDNFNNKWHVGSFDLINLENHCKKVTSVLRDNPEPKFQKLCLTSLPPELLYHIMAAADIAEARILGATCKHLYCISLPYVYTSREIILDYSSRKFWKDPKYQDDPAGFMQEISVDAVQRILDNIDFVNGRPDILGGIKTLSFSNNCAVHYPDAWQDPELCAPIWPGFTTTVLTAINITTFRMLGTMLVKDVVQAIAALPSLLRLAFVNCTLEPAAATAIVAGVVPVSPSVIDLNITISSNAQQVNWFLLLLYPSVQNLRLRTTAAGGVLLPSSDILVRCHLWRTLEVFYINSLDIREITILAGWISHIFNELTGPPPLTHFSLETNLPLPVDILATLLQALSPAPLEALILDGLLTVEPPLLTELGNTFPQLITLGIYLRQTHQQRALSRGSFSCMWTHPTWEYAPMFTAFQNLRNFGWNLDDSTPSNPAIIVDFETDFADTEARFERRYEEMDYDCHSGTARLLAVYCPSLELMTILGRTAFSWRIERNAENKISNVAVDFSTAFRLFPSYFNGWKK